MKLSDILEEAKGSFYSDRAKAKKAGSYDSKVNISKGDPKPVKPKKKKTSPPVSEGARGSHAERSQLPHHQSHWPAVIKDLKKFVPTLRMGGFDMSTPEKVHTLYKVGSQFSDRDISLAEFNNIIKYGERFRQFDLSSLMGSAGNYDLSFQLALRLKIMGPHNTILQDAVTRRDVDKIAKITNMNPDHIKTIFDDESLLWAVNDAAKYLEGMQIASQEARLKKRKEIKTQAGERAVQRREYRPQHPEFEDSDSDSVPIQHKSRRTREEKIVDMIGVYNSLSDGGRHMVDAGQAAKKLGVSKRTVDKWHEIDDPRIKRLDHLRPVGSSYGTTDAQREANYLKSLRKGH